MDSIAEPIRAGVDNFASGVLLSKAEHHLQNYRRLLESVQQLNPSTINFQSGE
jgi:hypothetical protein